MYKEARPFSDQPDRRGKIAEIFLLGRPRLDPQLAEKYVSFAESVKMVRGAQPWDPAEPKKPFLRALKEEMAEELGLKSVEEKKRLKIFTAVDSPLDRWHHADLFVELEDEKGEKSKIVTNDNSIKSRKISEETTKADVLFGEVPDPDEDKDGYKEAIRQIAKDNIKALNSKQYIGGRA